MIKTPRVDVMPFKGREVKIIPTGERPKINPELAAHNEAIWAPKKEKGYFNAWVPLVTSIGYTDEGSVDIGAGVMPFSDTVGFFEAVQNGEDYAPNSLNCLSVAVFPVTSDGHLFVSRRGESMTYPGVWNIPGGYMNSMLFAGRERCSEDEFTEDPRLFDIKGQALLRLYNQEFENLPEGVVTLRENPSALSFEYLRTHDGGMVPWEMEIGIVGDFHMTKDELEQHINEYEVAKGQREHDSFQFVPVESLQKLVKNQINLIGVDSTSYDRRDPERIFLLDWNLGELVGGALKDITGEEVDESVLGDLRSKGLSVNVCDSFPGITYPFPTSF